MKNALLVLFVIATVGLGALCLLQWRQLRVATARHQVAELTARHEAQARSEEAMRAREAEARAERLQREVNEFSAVTSNLRASDSAQRSNLTAMAERIKASRLAGTSGQGEGVSSQEMGDMLSKMMKDPSMRKVIRGQQKASIELMYSGLFKQMKLSPEEQAEFSNLLLDAQMRQVENVQGLLGNDGGDPALQREEFEAAKKETDEQIRGLLGEERFAEYKDYEKNAGERMQLDQLQTRLETAKMPLQEQQSAQLMKIMQEEASRVPPVFPTDSQRNPSEMKNLMTEENIEKQGQWVDDYNKRILDRAAAVLTPEQLQQYREFQEQQAAMQKLGLKMAKGMFGPKAPAK